MTFQCLDVVEPFLPCRTVVSKGEKVMAAARLTITSTTLLTSRLKKPICSVVSGGTSHASAAAAALSDIAGRALAAAAQATGSNNE